MQKRAALARALVTDPRIVLFDEPTTGQDPVRKNAILSMIAEYQRKFGFTAVLVSHEIPNVYFISNRILVLYDRTVIFQGTPERLENFDHPARDEFIHSLEGLQEELTGLYSKRQFKILYHNQLMRRAVGEAYCIAVFTLQNLDDIRAGLGHEAAQEVIRAMGGFIDRHLRAVGGFSTRLHINEFVAMLPYCDLAEADGILKGFVEDFQEQGIREIGTGARRQAVSGQCVEFSVLGGLARGQPLAEMDAVIDSAKNRQREIGRFRCPGEE
jgi:phospholipid/cholesterol/gamma-HCH transport system ATP-binding protein